MLIRLAWRSIWRNRRRTIITVTSIGFGLAIAIFFICLAEGVYAQLVRDGVRLQSGHITLEHPEYRNAPAIDLFLDRPDSLRAEINTFSDVALTKLVILGQGVAKTGTGSVGVAVMGVEPSVEVLLSPIIKTIISGRYLVDSDNSKIVIGSKLAKRLHLKEGKKLVLTTNDITGALTEDLCRVAGIFETGSEEIDGYIVHAPIRFLRALYNMPEGSATQLGIVLSAPESQNKIKKRVEALIINKHITAYPWQEILPELASYIKLDRGSNLIFQAILIFLILFTIFNTIFMSVLERNREFAMLLAIGTHPALLKYQLLLESFFIGLIGCCAGLIFGGTASYALQAKGFDLANLYTAEGASISGVVLSSVIHARVTPMILLGTSGIVLAATLLLSMVSMKRIDTIQITDTLR